MPQLWYWRCWDPFCHFIALRINYGTHWAPLIAINSQCLQMHSSITSSLIEAEMTHIRFISTSTIRAAASPNESTRRIELTPWDLQLFLVDPIQKGLLFFKPTPSQEKEIKGGSGIDHLKTSLSRTLDIFYVPSCWSPCLGFIWERNNYSGKSSWTRSKLGGLANK